MSSFFGTVLGRPLTMMVTVLATSALPCSSTSTVLAGTTPFSGILEKRNHLRNFRRLRNRNQFDIYNCDSRRLQYRNRCHFCNGRWNGRKLRHGGLLRGAERGPLESAEDLEGCRPGDGDRRIDLVADGARSKPRRKWLSGTFTMVQPESRDVHCGRWQEGGAANR